MLHLLHVQRADSGDVANTSFTNYSLGKLHLGCDVSHIHRVIVVVCYIQGVLQKKIRHTFKQNEKKHLRLCAYTAVRQNQHLSERTKVIRLCSHIRTGETGNCLWEFLK